MCQRCVLGSLECHSPSETRSPACLPCKNCAEPFLENLAVEDCDFVRQLIALPRIAAAQTFPQGGFAHLPAVPASRVEIIEPSGHIQIHQLFDKLHIYRCFVPWHRHGQAHKSKAQFFIRYRHPPSSHRKLAFSEIITKIVKMESWICYNGIKGFLILRGETLCTMKSWMPLFVRRSRVAFPRRQKSYIPAPLRL